MTATPGNVWGVKMGMLESCSPAWWNILKERLSGEVGAGLGHADLQVTGGCLGTLSHLPSRVAGWSLGKRGCHPAPSWENIRLSKIKQASFLQDLVSLINRYFESPKEEYSTRFWVGSRYCGSWSSFWQPFKGNEPLGVGKILWMLLHRREKRSRQLWSMQHKHKIMNVS